VVTRLSYEASFARLQRDGLDGSETPPPIPERLPQYDDEVLGLEFFRTSISDGADFSNLTLPRTFFGKSEISNANFRNADLTESNLCWNDFVDVDFSDAVLTRADLRASHYTRVVFTRADLRDCDLRAARFSDCSFDGAEMAGAKLSTPQGDVLPLSISQRAAIAWSADDGPLPDGG
jgi:BTB/POZ domain-containing protein KCTD9